MTTNSYSFPATVAKKLQITYKWRTRGYLWRYKDTRGTKRSCRRTLTGGQYRHKSKRCRISRNWFTGSTRWPSLAGSTRLSKLSRSKIRRPTWLTRLLYSFHRRHLKIGRHSIQDIRNGKRRRIRQLTFKRNSIIKQWRGRNLRPIYTAAAGRNHQITNAKIGAKLTRTYGRREIGRAMTTM